MGKKIFFIILLSIAGYCTHLRAQVGEPRHNFAVGGSAGYVSNTVSFQPRVKQNGMSGLTFGVTGRYVSEKYFKMICGAQLELNYTQLGWKEKVPEGATGTYQRTMNYIQIPFLAHLGFGKELRGLQFFVNAGPQIGFLLSESQKFSSDFDISGRTITTQYGKMAEKKFDYGIAAGAGLELRTGAGNFLLEGRYYYGLGDFYKTTKQDYFSRAANMTLCIKLTYLFDLSK
jgi:hypothetical protein